MSAELIHQMYIAYYQRPADPAGLIYWQDQLNAAGGGSAGWNAVAAAFANAAESSALYGNQTLGQKISAIYVAAFERAASADEVAYWEASGFNAAQIGFAVVNGAQNDDLLTVNKKVSFSTEFVKVIDPAGTGVGPFEFQYLDPSLGRTLMDPITKDSAVDAASVASQVTSTLPTLNTVNLTSGADVVTPQANAAEEIFGALGGTSPSLSRNDQIDGGSAQDTINVDMDGNFLLGFGSGGFMKNVEIVNLAATASSVTPKTFNFTGVSGVETINVGAGNAVINLNSISDTGITVNLSGQTTGTFEIGYATGAISATGSSMTIGTTDVGGTDAVTLLANGIVDLNLVANGSQNNINLGNSVNDLETIVVTGSGDMNIEAVGSGVTAIDASGLGGDFDLVVNTEDNANLVVSGQVISGGAGHDSIEINGSGIAQFTGTSIEELKFDAGSGEVIVRATAITGLTTLTYSGGNSSSAPQLEGLPDTGLTVNSINNGATTQSHVINTTGSINVNLNADPAQVALETKTNNSFALQSTTTDAVTLNVGPYVSASGTFDIQKASTLDVSVDANSNFAGTVDASAATTVNVSGAGTLTGASVTGEKITTANIVGASGSMTLASSAIQTVTVNVPGAFAFTSDSALSGVETLTINGGSIDLTNSISFEALDTATLNGTSSLDVTTIDKGSGLGNMTLDIDGLSQRFSASLIESEQGTITLDATGTTGTVSVGDLSASGAITISTGSAGHYSSNTIDSHAFTLDMSARSDSSSANFVISSKLSATDTTNISLGLTNSMSASVAIAEFQGEKALTIDGSNFGGYIGLETISASGNVTVSTGSFGDFSATTVRTAGNFTLDGSNSTSSGDITITTQVSGQGNITMSFGAGSGTVSAADLSGALLTLDGSTHKGAINLTNASASGNVVISYGGDQGVLSAETTISYAGNITIDGSNSTSSQMTLTTVTAHENITVSMGTGSGKVSATTVDAGRDFTLDASNYGGEIVFKDLSASGSIVVSVGGNGAFSASGVSTDAGNFTLDGSTATSAQFTVMALTAEKATISLGGGSGYVTLTSSEIGGNVIIDGTNNGGSINIVMMSASGNVTVSTGTQGYFSAQDVRVGKDTMIDAGAAGSASITLTAFSGTESLTIAGGNGSGNILISQADVNENFMLDATNSEAEVRISSLSASAAVTVSLGGTGGFSAAAILSANSTVMDFTNMVSSASVNLTEFSGGSLAVTLGSHSGDFSSNAISTLDGNSGAFTLSASSGFSGDITLGTLSASGAVTMSFGGGGAFTAAGIDTTKDITIDNSSGVNGAFGSEQISGSGVTVNLGSGSGNAVFSSITANTFTLTGTMRGDALTIASASVAGNVNITMDGTGSIAIGAIQSSALVTINAHLGNDGSNDETFSADLISASGIAITLTGGSGVFTGSVLVSDAGFTFNSEASIQQGAAAAQHLITSISGSAATITLGAGDNMSASVMSITADADIVMTGSAHFTNKFFSSDGVLTVTQNGGGDVNFSAITSSLGFAYNGTGLASGATFSAVTITTVGTTGDASGAVTFNYGDGGEAFISASTVDTLGAFSIIGSNLSTAEIAFTSISAEGAVNINLGKAGGEFQVSSIVTSSSFTFAASESTALNFDANTISASAAVTITLGAISDSTDATRISSIQTDGVFTLNAGAYRERLDVNDINAGTASLTFGDLSDGFSASVINVSSFTFAGGSGAKFSATIQDLTITDDGWSLTMAQHGNGLQVGNGDGSLRFAKTGSITGTVGSDTSNHKDQISASVNVAAGSLATFDFYMGADTVADSAHITNITANAQGGLYVRLHDFGTADGITTVGTAGGTSLVNLGSDNAGADMTANLVSVLGDVLNTTISTADTNLSTISLVGGAGAGDGSAVFTYGGHSWYIHDVTGMGTFGDDDIVIQFVDNTTVEHTRITFVDPA